MIDYSDIVTKTLVLLRYVFSLLHHLYCYPSCLLWVLIIWPLRRARPSLFWRLYLTLMDILHTMGTWYNWSAGYGVVEAGDDITPCLQNRTLVLVNHQTAGDIVVLWNVFVSRPKLLHDSMWIMNEEFKYTPFGILSGIRKDFFIPIGREKRAQGLVDFKTHLRKSYLPMKKKLIVLFPEGGFLQKRKAKSQKYALECNLPVLEYVCLPRLGAVQAILDVCITEARAMAELNRTTTNDDQLNWILDVTIAYPKGLPLDLSTLGSATRKPFNTTVVYRLFPVSLLPSSPEKIADWLYSRWEEKEKILSVFYSTGTIPVEEFCSNPIPPRLLKQNPLQHAFAHVLFILSSFGFYKLFCMFATPNVFVLLTLLVLYLAFLALKVTKVI